MCFKSKNPIFVLGLAKNVVVKKPRSIDVYRMKVAMSPKGNLRTSISIGISRGILKKIVRDEVHMSGWWLAIGNFVVDEEDSVRLIKDGWWFWARMFRAGSSRM
jgi:hypothetical protein